MVIICLLFCCEDFYSKETKNRVWAGIWFLCTSPHPHLSISIYIYLYLCGREEDCKPLSYQLAVLYVCMKKDKSEYGPSSNIWHNVRLCMAQMSSFENRFPPTKSTSKAAQCPAWHQYQIKTRSWNRFLGFSYIRWSLGFLFDFKVISPTPSHTVTNILWHCRIPDIPFISSIRVRLILHNVILFRSLSMD